MAELRTELSTAGRLVLRVKVLPRAPQTVLVGRLADGTLKIKVAAVPENGRANRALQAWLTAQLGGQIEILAGAGEPLKLLRITR